MQNSAFYIILCVIAVIAGSCRDKKEAILLECKIVSPKSNAKLVENRSLRISVNVTPNSNDIAYVALYVDEIEIHTMNTQAYDYDWDPENFDIGVHTIKAVAVDQSGLGVEDEIKIEIVSENIPPSITDLRDGIVYKIIKIGQQVWMAENLRYENEYGLLVSNNGGPLEEYGFLYHTSYGRTQGACPEEWHIPTRDNWDELIAYLGGDNVAGGKLKETGTVRWNYPNSGASNWSGFSARPAGSLSWDRESLAFGSSARFFTSFYGTYIFLDFDSEQVRKVIYHPSGEYYSIRCIRDY